MFDEDRYGLLFQSYFTGPTGQEIQAKGKDACILGAYLSSTRYATMIGLYELPVMYVDHDLPVLGGRRAIECALVDLADVGFAFYDHTSEVVWVVEMARIRCGLPNARVPLNARDKRLPAITRLYLGIKPNRHLEPFFDRYAQQLLLPSRRIDASDRRKTPRRGSGGGESGQVDTGHGTEAASPFYGPSKPPPGGSASPSASPFNGASKPLHSPFEASDQDQDQGSGIRNQDQKQDQGSGIRNQGSETGRTTSAAAQTPRAKAKVADDRTPDDNVEVITTLVLKELLPQGLTGTDLTEATKAQCAKLRIAYDSASVGKAIDSADARRRLLSQTMRTS